MYELEYLSLGCFKFRASLNKGIKCNIMGDWNVQACFHPLFFGKMCNYLHLFNLIVMALATGTCLAKGINLCFSKKLKSWNCSYVLAIEFQQQVIDAWESHGASAEEELREARRLLEQLKRKARDANEFPVKALPLPNNSTPAASRSSQPDMPLLRQSRTV